MTKEATPLDKEELQIIIQDLKENPIERFKLAFLLMTVLPFLVFLYLLISKLFTIDILKTDIGFILSISFFLALCGFLVGYEVVKKTFDQVLYFAAKAKSSNQLKSKFVATVSHDLMSPLAIIKMNVNNLQSSLQGQLTQKQKEIIEICRNVVERMTRLITDLLDLHKLEAGTIELKKTQWDLGELIENQTKEFSILIEKKCITLVKDIPPVGLLLWADKEKISQVVDNIVNNAIKFTPEGGSVTLKTLPLKNSVRFECIDTGAGIPADKLDKIFNRYERLDLTKQGTGLGLAISKDIIELHKGKIWVESTQGKGSSFIFVLPCDLREKNPDAAHWSPTG